ncbi:hypothetical protein QJS04_geneDACA015647 [Acorus gramineus]|uniref:ribonuclease Z n=1 Tax=Acorus gramineus TaxID=55184 RepID=A0AAV9AM52_ACOGR|nr:hypothetical protein QJS04_geneDACA015647 [Acorus gramineus]
MKQVSNLRLLFTSTRNPFNHSFSSSVSSASHLLFRPKTLLKPRPLFIAAASSSSSSGRRVPPPKGNVRKFGDFRGKDRILGMEDVLVPAAGFNKRRAEGRDKGKPKALQLKTRKLNPVNTICYFQILGTGMDTQDTSPSVFLFFDKQRFIFNAGEIDHMFLTRVCSETAGGLPGLLLTLAAMGEEGMTVNIWGPSDLKYLVDAMRSFIPNAAMVNSHSFGGSPNADGDASPNKSSDTIVLIDDEVVKISAFLLRPSYSEADVSDSSSVRLDGNMNPLSENIESAGQKLKPGDISVVYICELPEIKGKFDPGKAVALGLRPGPKYRDLQLGKSVLSDYYDITVHPGDVLGPSSPGPIVLLVDCPTQFHLKELLSIQALDNYYTDPSDHPREGLKLVNCVIHLGPASVTKNADYVKWMKKFGSAQHIMAGHEMKNTTVPILKSSARIATRLNYLCPQLFPSSGFPSIPAINRCSLSSIASSEEPFNIYSESVGAENLLKFHLRPYAQLGLDRSGIPGLKTPKDIINELLAEIPEIPDASKHVSQFWQTKQATPQMDENAILIEEPWMHENSCTPNAMDASKDCFVPDCLKNISREDLEIVLLGTGSSQPSKYRNVSSIYVNLFAKGSILLDCGEGTLAQLKRRFGIEGADEAVKSLKCIWISHIHADHHAGLVRILALRCKLLKGIPHDPLLVVGPRQLKRFLDAYSRLEDLDMQFLDCRDTVADSNNRDGNFFVRDERMQSIWKRPGSPVDMTLLTTLKDVLKEAGLEALAFGVVIQASERINNLGETVPGWKLVYSGDTRPCQALIDASHGATVLIHEATFEDGMSDEALERNHSTTKEAIGVGESAGVYRIILTHFSQRYPKIPVFEEDHMHDTCIAFDMMSVNAADLPVLPEVLPYLTLLFRNEMLVDGPDDAAVVAAYS